MDQSIYLYICCRSIFASHMADSDIKHGLINDLLNTGTDLGPGAGIENWIIDADGVHSPEWDLGPDSNLYWGPSLLALAGTFSEHLVIQS